MNLFAAYFVPHGVDPLGLEDLADVLSTNNNGGFSISDKVTFLYSSASPNTISLDYTIKVGWNTVFTKENRTLWFGTNSPIIDVQFSGTPKIPGKGYVWGPVAKLIDAAQYESPKSSHVEIYSFVKPVSDDFANANEGYAGCSTECKVFLVTADLVPRGVDLSLRDIAKDVITSQAKNLGKGLSAPGVDNAVGAVVDPIAEALAKQFPDAKGRLAAGPFMGLSVSVVAVCANGERLYWRDAAWSYHTSNPKDNPWLKGGG